MALIETVDLWQRRDGRDILCNINLHVERGEVFALIGPTGAGKTTLLRLLNLLDVPWAGKIYLDGVDTSASAGMRLGLQRRMAFVLQKPVVFNTSVYDNVAYGLKWRGMGGREVKEKVSRMLEVVALTDYRHRNARTLSGGEVQRVALARALVVEPEVLLLDEPTANLDPVSASRIEQLISGVIQQYATTTIMATHDLAQGQRIANRIGVLMDGELLQTGSPGDIFTAPRDKDVARFVGVENIIEGAIVSSEDQMVTIESKGKHIQAISDYAVGDEVCACVRPEDITLASDRLSTSARNTFEGKITWLVSMGPLTRVEIDCGFPLVALVTKRSAEEMKLVRGQNIFASFKATAIHVTKL
jgi:tungstate transport system ATP-binding protein